MSNKFIFLYDVELPVKIVPRTGAGSFLSAWNSLPVDLYDPDLLSFMKTLIYLIPTVKLILRFQTLPVIFCDLPAAVETFF